MVLQLDLSNNQLCGIDYAGRGTYTAEGITAIANAMRVNGGLTSINLSNNQLCGLYWEGIVRGNYTAQGITAIADALRVNGALTRCDLYNSYMGEEEVALIRSAVQGKACFELHGL